MSISINYIKQIISLQFIIHFSYFPTTDKYIFSLMYFPLTLHTLSSSPQSPYPLPAFYRTAAALPRRLL